MDGSPNVERVEADCDREFQKSTSSGDRTHDHKIKSLALYHLSYGGSHVGVIEPSLVSGTRGQRGRRGFTVGVN